MAPVTHGAWWMRGAGLALLGSVALPAATAAQAPVVDRLAATPGVVAPGATVTVEVEAHDPDCPGTCSSGCGQTVRSDLTVWSANGGSFVSQDNGTTGSPYAASAVWQAPGTEQTYTLTVTLSDSGSFLCGGRQSVSADVTVLVSSTPNTAPVVDEVSAHPVQVYPDRPSALVCDAHDPDGDPVTYSWSADLGAVTAGSGGDATFVSPRPGVATVTCTATDPGGAAGAGAVRISVTGAAAEKVIRGAVITPHRLSVDSLADLWVVDRGAGALAAVNLFTGQLAYRLPIPDATSVAVDWADDLLVGRAGGAQVLDRGGRVLRVLDAGPALGEVSDVAVDPVRRRWGVLYRRAGRVVLYGADGSVDAAFGSVGDAPEQLKSPAGLALAPDGRVVVADSGHGLIKVFDPTSGDLLYAFGGLGGGAGEFVQLDDVEVDEGGVIYASDAFQDWIQVFDADGTPREVLGSYGGGVGEYKTAAGIVAAEAFGRLVVASVNSSSLQVYRWDAPVPAEPVPEVWLARDSVAFGNQALNTVSAAHEVVLRNWGSAPLGIHGLSTTGDFSATHDCGDHVAPGGACALSVTFRPLAVGPRTGVLTVDTSAAGAAPIVALSGTGFLPPQLRVSPARLDFPDQPVGTVSESRKVVLTNTGGSPVALGDITVEGPFGLVEGCASVLPAGGSCGVSVTFTPAGTGDQLKGSLRFRTGAGDLVAPLEGRGVAVDVSPLPDRVDFGPARLGAEPSRRQVILTNAGTDLVSVDSVWVDGPDAESFALVVEACSGRRLWLTDICTLELEFAPGAGGTLAASLRIASNAGLREVPLVGFGVDESVLAIPALSPRGLGLWALLLAAAGWIVLRGRFGA